MLKGNNNQVDGGKMFSVLVILLATHPFLFVKEVGGQGDPAVYEQVKNDVDKYMANPSALLRSTESFFFNEFQNNRTWFRFYISGVGSPFYDIFENDFMKMTKEDMQLASPLYGNPLFFCINIPRMTYESYETFWDTRRRVADHRNPPPRMKIDKFNEEGVGWTTSQRRSKSRYNNAYSLFWIMEPTSFRWNRRFLPRKVAAKLLGRNVTDLGWAVRDHTLTSSGWRKDIIQDNFPHNENDVYSDVVDKEGDLSWQKAHEMERLDAINEGLYFHVEVTGIRDTNNGVMLKGWYHLKITLRKTTAGNVPVPKSQYVIDRLAVTARGLTFNHKFTNTGPFESFHDRLSIRGNITRYFEQTLDAHRPHRVWEGGVGEFMREFPRCRGVGGHKFVERQFVPCGSTGKTQWYYGNNFIYVKTDYTEYPDKPDVYGGGVVYNGDAEEIHLNYKLDQSFCNMLLAVDFVVNGVVIKGSKFNDIVIKDPREWTLDSRDDTWAVERSSSTRIEFTQDTYANPPDPIIANCQSQDMPWRKYEPPFIKPGALPPITFYGTADPIPREALELDCFVPLQKFNPTGGTNQPVESFHGAIQGILPAESFSPTVLPHRGLTLSHWYLYILPDPIPLCVYDRFTQRCRTASDFSQLIRDEVNEWDWRLGDPSDINSKPGDYRLVAREKTQIAYLDSTHKGIWISYFDWVRPTALDFIYSNPTLNDAIIRYGEDRAWPSSRQKDHWRGNGLMEDPFVTGSYFQPLYFAPVPFFGRATADISHQLVNSGVGHNKTLQKIFSYEHIKYSGEPGQSPPACDLYVSRYYLRILDSEDDEAYDKALGYPNDPNDVCFANTSWLTPDPALQYIRKVYVRSRTQNVNGTPPRHPSWYKKYLQFEWEEFCGKFGKVNDVVSGVCPTMLPIPYTTPSGKLLTTVKSPILRARSDGLEFKFYETRGLVFDSHLSLYIWDSRIIHGVFMTVLTIFVVPLTTFLARFYKETWMDSRLYIHRVWYFFHMMSILLITDILIVALHRQRYSSHVLGWSYTLASRAHRKMGYFAALICLSILFSGGIRAMSKKFRVFTITLHWLTGTVMYFCLMGCMLTSIFIQGSPSSYYDYSVYQPKIKTWGKEPVLWILVGWTLFEFLMLIRMFMLLKKSDKIMKLDPSRLYYPCPIPVIPEYFVFDAPLRTRRIRMFEIYVIVSILCTVAISICLVKFTPFTNPLRGLGFMTCTHEKNGSLKDFFPKYCPKLKGQFI